MKGSKDPGSDAERAPCGIDGGRGAACHARLVLWADTASRSSFAYPRTNCRISHDRNYVRCRICKKHMIASDATNSTAFLRKNARLAHDEILKHRRSRPRPTSPSAGLTRRQSWCVGRTNLNQKRWPAASEIERSKPSWMIFCVCTVSYGGRNRWVEQLGPSRRSWSWLRLRLPPMRWRKRRKNEPLPLPRRALCGLRIRLPPLRIPLPSRDRPRRHG